MKTGIFEVDIKGFRQLHESKPKSIIIRELLQNCIDEEITRCNIYLQYSYGKATITVEDDSPTGFISLADSWVLYAETYKRSNVKKRGRFNSGTKEVICLADYARIITTTGGVEFDVKKGVRTTLKKKREKGSEVYVETRMSREDYEECCNYIHYILKPVGVDIMISVDGDEQMLAFKPPLHVFNSDLRTEVMVEGKMQRVVRNTEIYLHKSDTPHIYEMGIPICPIECEFSIDVQQKVLLSQDRDMVDGKYLRDLFAIVLNNTVEELSKESISQSWIRNAMDSDKVEAETVQEVKDKRFGDKALIFNPFDPNANDEAISKGYRLIYGSEMSKQEWDKMKTHAGLVSTSAKFGMAGMPVTHLEWQKHHFPVYRLAKRIAADFFNIPNMSMVIFKEAKISHAAYWGNGQLSFNLAQLNQEFFLPDEKGVVKQDLLDLLIHELAHCRGNHTEHNYHDAITSCAAWLARKVYEEKNYIKLT